MFDKFWIKLCICILLEFFECSFYWFVLVIDLIIGYGIVGVVYGNDLGWEWNVCIVWMVRDFGVVCEMCGMIFEDFDEFWRRECGVDDFYFYLFLLVKYFLFGII